MSHEVEPQGSTTEATVGEGTATNPSGGTGVHRLSPLNDVVFSCVFDDVKQTGPAMREFLNALLESEGDEPIAEIIEMRSQYPVSPEYAKGKFGRLDVRAMSTYGSIFYVEVQHARDAMTERCFYYGAKLADREFKSGTPYNKLP